MLCSRCKIDQPRDQFGPSADMWPTRRECKKCSRHSSQIKRHGLDAYQRGLIAAEQGGCAVCGHPEPGSKGWVVDHDRQCCATDKSCPKCRRGVVCQWCNSVLGYAFDRPETLLAAIEYLTRADSNECSWHMPVACAPSICDAHMHERNERTEQTKTVGHLVDRSSPSFTCARVQNRIDAEVEK